MVILANVSRIKTFIYVIIILLLINLAVLAFIYFRYLADSARSEIAPIEESSEHAEPHPPIITVRPATKERSFVIDYNSNVFLKDGQPFKYIGGSLHYFRVPREYWQDRLRKYRAAGLNVVTTYVEWSTHEPQPRKYNFHGDADLEYFLHLAHAENLLVILRPGPYICAERDFGGFPPWLLMLYPNIELRTNNTDYQREVKTWLDLLLSKMNKYLYGNGGPIIMVQVENEYGSYPVCNMEHKIWLSDLMRSHVKDGAVLFTTDGGAEHYLRCGAIPNVYATVDFGTGASVEDSFAAMRLYSPKGPLVNSEFYPGWLTHWEEPMQRVETTLILNMMTQMLERNASFNFYMFYGGTNFGFMNGANFNDKYTPQLTSYDYDAPLDEAGDPTPKYYAIRELIGKHLPLPKIPIPKPSPRASYGTVKLNYIVSLFECNWDKRVVAHRPLTFEELKVNYGYVLYETKIPDNIADPSMLDVFNLHDRAIVYINQEPVTILSRSRNINSAPIMALPGATLSLLVENQGRINFGKYLKDEKGLIDVPRINNIPLYSWEMTPFPFSNTSWIQQTAEKLPQVKHTSRPAERPPAIYYGWFTLPPNAVPQNTFIDPTGWGKGITFVNGHNIGRYWPGVGPQVTLFVPGSYLLPAPEKNFVTMVETESAPEDMGVLFTNKPYLDKIPPKI